jgi:hypothetical protein
MEGQNYKNKYDNTKHLVVLNNKFIKYPSK